LLSQNNLDSFLKLGYFLDYKNPNYYFDFSKVNKKKFKEKDIDILVKEGTEIFINAIQNNFEFNKKHVVPISGGLDSRAILSALLEFTEASNISTYTFGTPGTIDYEIGNKIATDLGTKHSNFSLINHRYKMEELLDISNRIDHQTVLFHHAPVWKLDELFNNHIVWSGFFGGQLFGEDYHENAPNDINKAIEYYINRRAYQYDINLLSDKKNPFKELIDIKNIDSKISIVELIIFFNNELKFIAPHVLMKGFNYKTPFIDQNMINFFLSIDNKYRTNQFLYKRILLERFPNMFLYPIKDNVGLSLKTAKPIVFSKKIYYKIKRKFTGYNPYVNYLDFDINIREKQDLKEIIRLNINDLYNRDIINWIDIRDIFQQHIERKGNYGKALILLTSLEIHMKAKKLK